MVNETHTSFSANDRSYYSLLKKEIHKHAEEAGFTPDKLNKIDLVLAEMTSNLFKYSDDGEVLMGIFANGGKPYVELISIDNGPGMANPSKMMEDGVSSSSTLGHGFGSMKRLSDEFDLYSSVGWGTIVLSRIYSDFAFEKKKVDKLQIRSVVVAKPGETLSGDGMAIKKTGRFTTIMLADGLGHGPEANKAVNEAETAFRFTLEESPSEMLRYIHGAIKKTRGAVMTILCYDHAKKQWCSTGVGNIALRFNGPVNFKNQMSYNGIVGHNIPNTMNDQRYTSEEYNVAILCSDGIKTRWEVSKYPMIFRHDLSILAAAVYKDHARRTDDMSVVVAKIK
jgi:anti-sigma regulatory factor (Ser/Thr protein kinase)